MLPRLVRESRRTSDPSGAIASGADPSLVVTSDVTFACQFRWVIGSMTQTPDPARMLFHQRICVHELCPALQCTPFDRLHPPRVAAVGACPVPPVHQAPCRG